MAKAALLLALWVIASAQALSTRDGPGFVAPVNVLSPCSHPQKAAGARAGVRTRHVAGAGGRGALAPEAKGSGIAGRMEGVGGRLGVGLRASGDSDHPANPNAESSTAANSYGSSSTGVKAVVSGLTNLVNAFMRREADLATVERPERDSITPQELLKGIEGDYERRYLWTGDIDPYLYDYDCVFTDPTLSFSGLETFQRNLANLRPFIDTLVQDDCAVEMYSCNLSPDEQKITASWRMVGRLKVPWTPTIDLNGTTVFTYAPTKGNRITDYRETWETPPASVLWQLFVPT
mmetsp:Transcript_18733/g.36440  ORF Transcript_18733/g.36440 Transcript_18733/m.36440 type:complete len:291 (+) Transcript_18733:3-875(+)